MSDSVISVLRNEETRTEREKLKTGLDQVLAKTLKKVR